MKERLRVKVCGMRNPGNILAVAAIRPDLMGFIFYKESPRYVGIDFQIPVALPVSVKRVGVFVNERTDHLLKTAEKHQLDFVQLHGSETPRTCSILQRQGLKVIKAFGVDKHFRPNLLNEFDESVDYFLFDTNGPLYGGHGKRFNWRILDYYNKEVPFFLSGGINPENAIDISSVRSPFCFGIDVNSGVETEPGIKDIAKLEKVIKWL